jgi:hypothetical protein
LSKANLPLIMPSKSNQNNLQTITNPTPPP